jgi:putative heme degradation protein
MTDTHQFLQLVKSHKMNRLGANRIAGAPYAVPLDPVAVTQVLHRAADDRTPLMIFVGNPGCIQIHGGLIDKVVPMGPWINVMDPRFKLHLRADLRKFQGTTGPTVARRRPGFGRGWPASADHCAPPCHPGPENRRRWRG